MLEKTTLFISNLLNARKYSLHTIKAYDKDLKQFVEFLAENGGQTQWSEVSRHDVRLWLADLVEKGYSPKSVNRKAASLKSFFSFLIEKNILKKSPAHQLKSLKTIESLVKFVKEDDLEQLLSAPHTGLSEQELKARIIIELLYGLGLREAELIELKAGSLDLSQCTAKIRGKGNKERLVPFTKKLSDLVQHYLLVKEISPQDFLITTTKGKKAYPMMIYRAVNQFLRSADAGIKSPHTLRHSYATHLLNRGAELNTVKTLLGHSSLSSTQIYAHNSTEKLKKAYAEAHPRS